MEFLLDHVEAMEGAGTDELARTLLARFGLVPRKKDGAAQMHRLLLELSERKKAANREKKPEMAVVPVETMAPFAGIARQTMYEYLRRWLDLNILKKTSFVADGKVVIGYELNGTNIESAFRKGESTIKAHIDHSFRIVEQLQSEVKRDKLRKDPEESKILDDAASQSQSGPEKQDESQSHSQRIQ